jgi:hypothetical protein
MTSNNIHATSAAQRADPARELARVAAMSHRSLGDSMLQRIASALGELQLTHHPLVKLMFFLFVFVLATLFFRAVLHQMVDRILEQPKRAELVYVPPVTVPLLPKEIAPVIAGKGEVQKAPAVPAPAVPVPTGDCAWQDQEVVIKVSASSKASDYVHFVAMADSSVCVMSGRNQTTSLTLRAGDARSVTGGAAPWRVRSSNWSGVKIFFQGSRLAVPVAGAAQIRIELSPASCATSPANC